VANLFSDNVMKLTPSTGAIAGTYQPGDGPGGIGTFKIVDGAAGVLFDGTNLWVVNNGDSTLMKITPATGSIVATYATGKGPFSVAFDGAKVWVTNFASNSVSTTAAN